MSDANPPTDPPTDEPKIELLDDPIAALLADLWTEPKIRMPEVVAEESVEEAEVESLPPEAPAGVLEAISHYSRRGFLIALAILVGLGLALVVFGARVILESSDGRMLSAESDTTKPGFEAIVEKTPTALVMATTEDGQLDSVTLLSLTSESEGGIMSIPVQTNVYIAPTPGVILPITLQALYAANGAATATAALGELLNLNFTDTVIVKSSEWQSLVSPVSALAVSNPSAVVVAGEEVFAKGSIQLPAENVWSYLSTRSDGGSELDRASRQQAFWRSWLAAIGTAGGSSALQVPTSSGFGRYLRNLAGDQLTVETLPVTELPATEEVPLQFRLAPGLTGPSVIAAIVPFPDGAPGRRPRLKVLDGTGELANAEGPAVLLAAGGGQVDIIGNAAEFGVESTEITYFDPAQLEAANRMRSVLGVGDVVESRQTNSALDLTVTIGADYQSRSTTTSLGGPGA
ncbi:unannotated protein [freshwater metagenome]